MLLNGIQSAYKLAPTHFVKLARNMAKLGKTMFVKALQDYDRFVTCGVCDEAVRPRALTAITQLFAHVNFIIVSLDDIDPGKEIHENYFKFYELNKEALSKRVKFYLK